MVDKLVKWILSIFGTLVGTLMGKYILIFLISLMPILELRGGLIAASLLDVPAFNAFLVCLLANIIIIPFVLFLVETILELLSKIKFFKKIIDTIRKKVLKKKKVIEKYGYLGVFIFVAIPLPGSGAWTGCFLAVLLGLDKKKSFLAALLGVLLAGIVMLVFSYGILKGIIG